MVNKNGSSWGSPSHGDVAIVAGKSSHAMDPRLDWWTRKSEKTYIFIDLLIYLCITLIYIYIYITYYILYITYYIWLWYIFSVIHYILYMTMIYIIYHILHITYYIWLWYIYDINDHCVDLHLPDLSLPTCSDDLQHLRRKRAPSLRKNIGLMLA